MRIKTSTVLAQFNCPFCGKGFEQKSKLRRHTETAHPPSAPSAADIERMLKGIRYPKTKEELTEFAAQRTPTASPGVLNLIGSLPRGTFRDSAEVAIAFGELKNGKRPRSPTRVIKLEAPSKKGGRSAVKSMRVSASGIAIALKGIDFPKTKRGIITHVKKRHPHNKKEIVLVLNRMADKKYQNLVEVEKEVGKIK